MEENCPICQDELVIEIKKLNCRHKMHKNCYKQLLCSNAQKKCPICRVQLVVNNSICGYCFKEIDSRPEKCEVLVSEECGCFFHYNCVKKGREIECKNCAMFINTEKVNGLTYTYLDNAFTNWVGNYYGCMHHGCNLNGNPRYYGYCLNHKKNEATNNAIFMSLKYFVKYVYEKEPYKKYLIFLKLIEFMNKYHKYDDINIFDLSSIRIQVDNFINL